MENKKRAIAWRQLLRSAVAMSLILAMLLCGCASKDPVDETKPGASNPSNETVGGGETVGTSGDGTTDDKQEPMDAVDAFTALYGNLLEAIGGNNKIDYSGKMDLTVTMGQELLNALQQQLDDQEAGIQIGWLQKLGLAMNVAYSDDKMQLLADLSLNNKQILTMDMLMDMMNGKLYIGAPELNDQYIVGEMATEDMEGSFVSMDQLLEEYGDVVSALPAEEALNTLLHRYLEIAQKAMRDPTKAEETLSCGTVSQKVTATTYNIMRSDVLNIATAVLTAAKTDAELEKMVDAFAVWYNATAAKENPQWTNVDLHAELLSAVDDMLSDIEDTKVDLEDADFLRFVVYADGEEPVGARVVFSDGNESTELYIYSLTSGSNTAFVADFAGTMKLAGTGTVSGGKASGSYVFTVDGTDMVTFEVKEVDTDALAKGELKGTIRVSLNQELMEDISDGLLLTTDTVFELVLNVGDTNAVIDVNLYHGDKFIVGLNLVTKQASAGKIELPANTVNAEDSAAMEQWLENLKLDAVIAKLREAGVPEDLLTQLEQAIKGENMVEPEPTQP